MLAWLPLRTAVLAVLAVPAVWSPAALARRHRGVPSWVARDLAAAALAGLALAGAGRVRSLAARQGRRS